MCNWGVAPLHAQRRTLNWLQTALSRLVRLSKSGLFVPSSKKLSTTLAAPLMRSLQIGTVDSVMSFAKRGSLGVPKIVLLTPEPIPALTGLTLQLSVKGLSKSLGLNMACQRRFQ